MFEHLLGSAYSSKLINKIDSQQLLNPIRDEYIRCILNKSKSTDLYILFPISKVNSGNFSKIKRILKKIDYPTGMANLKKI